VPRVVLAVLVLLACAVAVGTNAIGQGPGAQPPAAPSGPGLGEPAAFGGPQGRRAITGPWVLALDPQDRGRAKGWQAGTFEGRRVELPHVPNADQITGDAGRRNFQGSIAWYRTQVTVDRTGVYSLGFESVHHRATVWVDGRVAARHTGVYLPFEHRVALEAGQPHTIVVRADFRDPLALKRSGWHRTWFNFGGINREVTLRPLGPSDLSAPEIRTRLQPDGAARVDVAVRVSNRTGTDRAIAVTGRLRRDGQEVELPFPAIDVPARATRTARTTVVVGDPALWAPGSPRLYDLELGVAGEAGFRERVGLRELTWRGGAMFLNGRRLRLHGASIHEDARGRGDALLPADMDGIVRSLQAIGANATRSQHQLHPALLERLDAAGILVWMGLGPIDAPGAWTSKTPAQVRVAHQRVDATYAQTQTHPSIIAWNLANEVAGNGHPDGQAAFIDAAARELRRRDPGRMTAVDVWGAHPPKGRLGILYRNVDAIAITNYSGWYFEPLAPRAQVAALIRSTTEDFERTFKGKVLVVSEFGAEANRLNPSPKPGSFSFQTRLLTQHIDLYRSRPALSGMLIWNLRDFALSPGFAGGSIKRQVPGIRLVPGINQKGLFDFDGTPKPSVETVRRRYAALGTGLAG
jgi:hypothetical protein